VDKINTIIKFAKEFLVKHPHAFLLLFIFIFLEGLISAAVVLAVVPFADFLIDTNLEDPSRVTVVVIQLFEYIGITVGYWSFALLFVLLNLISAISKIIVHYSILKIKYHVQRTLYKDTLGLFFKARWEFFGGSKFGKILNTLNKELEIVGSTISTIASLFAQLIQLFVYLIVPFILDPIMTLSAVGLALIFTLPFLYLNKLSYRLGKENTRTSNIAIGVLTEILQLARIILAFGRQNKAQSSYLNAFDDHIKVTLQSQILKMAVPSFSIPLGMFAAVIALGISLQQGEYQLSEMTAVMWSLLSALPILSHLLRSSITITNFMPSYEQLILLREQASQYQEIPGKQFFKKITHSIEFNNISFSYPQVEKTIYNLNLKINKGSMTALIGESGSGKSTIVDLLLGLQHPATGSVLIDGVDFNDYQQNTFRQKIGYVPQDPVLFHLSIRDNLLWALDAEPVGDSELWDALKLSNADRFVRELPNKLDTLVGDRGVRLSGGQRQRIALARALVRKPELLILDEATSSLDSSSEKLIQKSINNLLGTMTILIIAHRLSTIQKSDYIYILKTGKVIEEGTYSGLSLNNKTQLYKMLQAQS
jgi:ATP-binding cassette subfamily B protein